MLPSLFTWVMAPLLLAGVALPLKILAAIVVFGPMIVFARLLFRAAHQDGKDQEERGRRTRG